MFVSLANKRCEQLYRITKEIGKARTLTDSRFTEHIKQDQEGLFFVYEQGLKDSLTDYTATEKENSILDAVNKIKAICKEIGATKSDLKELFTSGFDINAYKVRQLAKASR